MLAVLRLRARPFSTAAPGAATTPRILRRLQLYDAEKKRQQDEQRTAEGSEQALTVNVKERNGNVVVLQGKAGQTTLRSLLQVSHSHLLASAVVARTTGGKELVELTRPLSASCDVDLLSYDDPAGRDVFWHSAAHILGAALERIYGDRVLLCDGPPIDRGGFFYEFFMPDGSKLGEADLEKVTDVARAIAEERAPFERLQVSREFALEMFNDSKFKQHYIAKAPPQSLVSLYRCNNFIDFCRGPHIANTGQVKGFQALQVSGAYWLGDQSKEQLQRVYGIAFQDQKQAKDWNEAQEKARKSDHRVIGKQQKLFMMHPLSPGSVFMLPHGAHICNRLMDFMRSLYHSRSYQEVITPQVYMKKLWEISGHWENYRDDMFIVRGGKDHQGGNAQAHDHAHDGHEHNHDLDPDHGIMGLKPMNCPGHCLIFDSELYSYRQLPVRIADFSPLHRNEISGALSGLTRVRKFMQDDAHIFCTPEQIGDEVASVLSMIADVYGVFGFQYKLSLSTRPQKYLGELEVWNLAEESLHAALKATNKPFSLSEGDGAFYGPKIDITVEDALGRSHQTATVQLDFQLPERFKLRYMNSAGVERRPVMIHRAVLGSVERMLGILIEHYSGKWPFWLSPRQVYVIPVHESCQAYAAEVYEKIKKAGCAVELSPLDRINKNTRDGIVMGFNYLVVVGDREVASKTVSIRTRENSKTETMDVDKMVDLFKDMNKLPLSSSSST